MNKNLTPADNIISIDARISMLSYTASVDGRLFCEVEFVSPQGSTYNFRLERADAQNAKDLIDLNHNTTFTITLNKKQIKNKQYIHGM